jgi:hypothetical protein
VSCEEGKLSSTSEAAMNSTRVWIALYFVLLTVLVVTAGWHPWNIVHMYPATPETESAFLKNYTPKNVLDRFSDGLASYSGGRGAGAGNEFVTHTANFEGDFALCSEQFMPLMDALSDDVAAQLVKNGARIMSQIGLAEAGFHFDYRVGKTSGSVTIAPLQLHPDLGNWKSPRPSCNVDIQTRVDVTEKWFPKSRP